jgi:hypothetical protein
MPVKNNEYNLVSHIVWNKKVSKEDKVTDIELINQDIRNKYNGSISIGAFYEHETMLPYSETTLKKDKNGMSSILDGYINVENSRIVRVDYSQKVLKK